MLSRHDYVVNMQVMVGPKSPFVSFYFLISTATSKIPPTLCEKFHKPQTVRGLSGLRYTGASDCTCIDFNMSLREKYYM